MQSTCAACSPPDRRRDLTTRATREAPTGQPRARVPPLQRERHRGCDRRPHHRELELPQRHRPPAAARQAAAARRRRHRGGGDPDRSHRAPVHLRLRGPGHGSRGRPRPPAPGSRRRADVRLDQSFHFRAPASGSTTALPAPGAAPHPDGTIIDVRRVPRSLLEWAVRHRLHELLRHLRDAPEDGVIDALLEVADTMPTDASFFARSFDTREDASPPFRFTIGSAMPFLDAGFLGGEGAQFFGGPVHADAVVFAGKSLRRRGPPGSEIRPALPHPHRVLRADLRGRRPPLRRRRQLLRRRPASGQQRAGLVVSAYHRREPGSPRGLVRLPELRDCRPGDVGEISGNIKGAASPSASRRGAPARP